MENAYFLFVPVGCGSALYVAQAGVDCYSNDLFAAYHFFLTICLVMDLGLLHRHIGVVIWSDKSALSPLSPNTCGRVYECQFHDLWGDRIRRDLCLTV